MQSVFGARGRRHAPTSSAVFIDCTYAAGGNPPALEGFVDAGIKAGFSPHENVSPRPALEPPMVGRGCDRADRVTTRSSAAPRRCERPRWIARDLVASSRTGQDRTDDDPLLHHRVSVNKLTFIGPLKGCMRSNVETEGA